MTPICGIVADQIVYPMPVNNIRTSDRFLQKSEKILIGSVKFLPNWYFIYLTIDRKILSVNLKKAIYTKKENDGMNDKQE